MRRITFLILIALTALVYAATLRYGFVYEDLSTFGSFGRPWQWAVDLPIGRSFSLWTYHLNFLWTGDQPWSFHLVNVALHLLNGALLYTLAKRLIGMDTALIATAFFLLLPIQTEAVAYIGARPDLMVVGFTLGLLLLARPPWTWWRVLLIGIGLRLVMTTKETGIVALALLPLGYALQGVPWPRLSRVATFGAAFISVIGVALVARWAWLHPAPIPGAQHGMFGFLAVQSFAVCRLLLLTVVPYHLTVDYDYDPFWHGWEVLTLLALLVAVPYVLAQWRRWPALAATVAYCGLVLAPRFLMRAEGEYLNEHQWYQVMPALSVWCALVLTQLTNGLLAPFSEKVTLYG